MAEKPRKRGFMVQQFSDIPGVKAMLDTGREDPCVALLGELDADALLKRYDTSGRPPMLAKIQKAESMFCTPPISACRR